jgi:hypothetical protein
MPSTFPTALDAWGDVPANMATVPTHATQHNQLRDMVQATQAAVGASGSSRLVQRFATVAARTAAVPSPVDGMVSWVDTPGQLSVYFGGVWQPVAGVASTVTTSPAVVVDGSGWSCTSIYAAVKGGLLQFNAAFERTGATITVPANGDIANVTLGTFPVSLRGGLAARLPVTAGGAGRVASGDYLPTTGELRMTAVSAGSDIATGNSLSLGGLVLLDP